MSKMTHFGNRVGAFAGTIAIARALFNRSQEIVKPSHPRRLCLATLEEQPDRREDQPGNYRIASNYSA